MDGSDTSTLYGGDGDVLDVFNDLGTDGGTQPVGTTDISPSVSSSLASGLSSIPWYVWAGLGAILLIKFVR